MPLNLAENPHHAHRLDVEAELQALAVQVAIGNPGAIDELTRVLKEFIRPYVTTALRQLPSSSTVDAEDLTQDVWMECFRMAAQYNPERGKAAAYFGRIAFQTARYRIRSWRQRLIQYLDATSDWAEDERPGSESAETSNPELNLLAQESVAEMLGLMRHQFDNGILSEFLKGDLKHAERAGFISPEHAKEVQLARRRARRLLRRYWRDLPPRFKVGREDKNRVLRSKGPQLRTDTSMLTEERPWQHTTTSV